MKETRLTCQSRFHTASEQQQLQNGKTIPHFEDQNFNQHQVAGNSIMPLNP